MTMLAEFGTLSLEQVLQPAMDLALGYPIEAQTANAIENNKSRIKEWPYSKKVFLPHLGEKREAPEAGEIFVQQDLYQMLLKLVEAERAALKSKNWQRLGWGAGLKSQGVHPHTSFLRTPREEGFDFDLTKKMDHLLTSIAVPSA